MTVAAQDGGAGPGGAAAAGPPPQAVWAGADGAWTLKLSGDWRASAQALPAPPPAMKQGRLAVAADSLGHWDARLASWLWQQLSGIDQRRVELDLSALPAGLQHILALALPPPAAPAGAGAGARAGAGASAARRRLRRPGWVAALGGQARAAWRDGRETLSFVGEVLLSCGRLLRGRSDMRAADLAWQIEQTGPRSVPIVSLVAGLVSLIVAYMGAAQLELYGAQIYVANLVTVGVVREIAALITGIILAGRVGAAFAAQIGSMRANEEIDALSTLGVDATDYLVMPRLLAMVLMAPLLTAYAALVGVAAGWTVAVVIYGVEPLDYLMRSGQALTLTHVLIGLFKGVVYAVLVALAGCRQGLAAGRSAQDVGQATTRAVVQGIVWIAVAASALTVVFERLDW
jgi:phospholipid/cholesterol/gamma-HCH transport system permease protein